MKVLVATARTQGTRQDDYDCCVEGELVWVGFVCATDRANPAAAAAAGAASAD